MAIERYINRSSNCYDENFTKLIKKLRPDWFKEKITVRERVLSIIKQNPGVNAGGLYQLSFGNINSKNLNATLEELRKEDAVHFKIVSVPLWNSNTMGRYSQKWYPSSQTKEKKKLATFGSTLKRYKKKYKNIYSNQN